MNRDSNGYTFLFAALMVVVVATSLAFAATALKEKQAENVRKEKMQNILSTIGIETDREGAEVLYNKYITEQLALKAGGAVDAEADAFKIELSKEVKKKLKALIQARVNRPTILVFASYQVLFAVVACSVVIVFPSLLKAALRLMDKRRFHVVFLSMQIVGGLLGLFSVLLRHKVAGRAYLFFLFLTLLSVFPFLITMARLTCHLE